MIQPNRLQELLSNYSEEAKLFFYSYGLANLVIDKPIDHVAIKALNRETYEQYLDIYKPLSERLSSARINDRDLATVVLQKPLEAGTFGSVNLLEIIEPKPGAIATTYDLIDHIEIFTNNLEEAASILKNKDVLFKEKSNGGHNTLVIEINEWGQEVKFTDTPLGEIVDHELKAGSANIIS